MIIKYMNNIRNCYISLILDVPSTSRCYAPSVPPLDLNKDIDEELPVDDEVKKQVEETKKKPVKGKSEMKSNCYLSIGYFMIERPPKLKLDFIIIIVIVIVIIIVIVIVIVIVVC